MQTAPVGTHCQIPWLTMKMTLLPSGAQLAMNASS